MHRRRDLRVVDFSTGSAGPYCTKRFADADAEVVLVEEPGAASPRTPLFRFLHASKRAITGAPTEAKTAELIAGAGLVVEDFGTSASFDRAALLARHPQLVLCSTKRCARGSPSGGAMRASPSSSPWAFQRPRCKSRASSPITRRSPRAEQPQRAVSRRNS